MRAEDCPRAHLVPSHSKAGRRRRRLARGVARWDLDRTLCAEPTRRVCTITLTVADADPDAAIGAVRDFWAKVRRTWLGTRYFCWLELQARGAVHYHCVWLNPPHLKRVNLVAWVDRAWALGRTRVRFSDGSAGMQRELDYVIGYTKKMGRKSYQQRYDDVPSQLRTFMSQRLEIPPTELDKHLDHDVYRYVGKRLELLRDGTGQSEWVEEHLVYLHRLEHVVPAGGRCTALEHRRRPRIDRRNR